MKNFILFLAAISLFTACNKVVTEQPIDSQIVPENVVQAIKTNFTDASDLVYTTLKINDLYGADFQSNQKQHTAVISVDGTIKELTVEATTVVLPASIMVYINANYPNAIIIKSYEKFTPVTKIVEGYGVQLTTAAGKRLELSFNLLGVWLSTIELPATPIASKYAIKTFAELPANIQTFLNSRHTGFTFYSGTGVVSNNTSTYYVSLKIVDTLHNYSLSSNAAILSYSTSGYVNKGTTTTTTQSSIANAAAIPPVITTYLNTKYAGWQFLKGLIMYDNNIITSYLITAQVGTDLYYISFNATGGFIGAKKG
jgi:hypothetical protein